MASNGGFNFYHHSPPIKGVEVNFTASNHKCLGVNFTATDCHYRGGGITFTALTTNGWGELSLPWTTSASRGLNFMASNYHCRLGVGLSFTVPDTILGVEWVGD